MISLIFEISQLNTMKAYSLIIRAILALFLLTQNSSVFGLRSIVGNANGVFPDPYGCRNRQFYHSPNSAVENYVQHFLGGNFTSWVQHSENLKDNVTVEAKTNSLKLSSKLFSADYSQTSDFGLQGFWRSRVPPCVTVDLDTGILNATFYFPQVEISANYTISGKVLDTIPLKANGTWRLNLAVFCKFQKTFSYESTSFLASPNVDKEDFSFCGVDDYDMRNGYFNNVFKGGENLETPDLFENASAIPFELKDVVKRSFGRQIYNSLHDSILTEAFEQIQLKEMFNKYVAVILSNHTVVEVMKFDVFRHQMMGNFSLPSSPYPSP